MILKAVLFDLDGTLLPIDTKSFMGQYLQAIAQAAAQVVPPDVFIPALLNSTQVMLEDNSDSHTNEQVFWQHFDQTLGDDADALKPVLDDFYATEFASLGEKIQPLAAARQAAQTALAQGLRIVVATNPVFPRSAIHDRMAWAKVDDLPWELVTSYENMHACKPQLAYYRQIADQLQLDPQQCLMVGNHVEEDLVAGKIGMRTGLVTDYIIDGQPPLEPDWTGSLSDLADWLAELAT